ncbi:hypothetical protein QQX10_10725 [Demequina sp. SYSU T00039]|uniref:Uncharacterized protein n=1 Tax=Demequina lignilytica TaxID=3051663 RepID=A0AAW7M7A3_9MICO|nr:MULTISPECIES: hypothetical protein [unclassified Demequina]MDN4478663.1 hypothetical protein [Demequina sp. SYSU T00039-1]MDN4488641.1 hypothetical protein [Demequina sp. SYSU T00039]
MKAEPKGRAAQAKNEHAAAIQVERLLVAGAHLRDLTLRDVLALLELRGAQRGGLARTTAARWRGEFEGSDDLRGNRVLAEWLSIYRPHAMVLKELLGRGAAEHEAYYLACGAREPDADIVRREVEVLRDAHDRALDDQALAQQVRALKAPVSLSRERERHESGRDGCTGLLEVIDRLGRPVRRAGPLLRRLPPPSTSQQLAEKISTLESEYEREGQDPSEVRTGWDEIAGTSRSLELWHRAAVLAELPRALVAYWLDSGDRAVREVLASPEAEIYRWQDPAGEATPWGEMCARAQELHSEASKTAWLLARDLDGLVSSAQVLGTAQWRELDADARRELSTSADIVRESLERR